MEKRASQLDFPSLIIAFSTGKIQKEIGEIVRKIFPLKTIEVRKVELHRIKKGTEKIDKKEPETEEAPVEETEETA
jgi:ribosomal protein S3AE